MPDYPDDLRFLTIETYTLKELKTCSEQCKYFNWVEYKKAILIEVVKDYYSSGMPSSKVQDPFLLNLLKSPEVDNSDPVKAWAQVLRILNRLDYKMEKLKYFLSIEQVSEKIPWYGSLRLLKKLYKLLIKYNLIAECTETEFLSCFIYSGSKNNSKNNERILMFCKSDATCAVLICVLVSLQLLPDHSYFDMVKKQISNRRGGEFTHLSNNLQNMKSHEKVDKNLLFFLKEFFDSVPVSKRVNFDLVKFEEDIEWQEHCSIFDFGKKKSEGKSQKSGAKSQKPEKQIA